MTPFSGRVWHSVFATRRDLALDGAQHREGRFHHDGQKALYLSPTPEHARLAISVYVGPDDPPRVILPLQLSMAQLLDLRDAGVQRQLGLQGHEASVNWRPERAAGLPATP
ncbi:MAG: RES domain-containing protein [Albidovulum sp.]|uniref:RES domain-containing protein n=1 Tax=Albidovulum sp. TaxID=1872424 RepID=UPI003C9944A2